MGGGGGGRRGKGEEGRRGKGQEGRRGKGGGGKGGGLYKNNLVGTTFNSTIFYPSIKPAFNN